MKTVRGTSNRNARMKIYWQDQSHIFPLLFQQKMFEMNRLLIQWYIPLAFVHQVECHVPDNIIPNKHFQSVLHIDQYVSKDIHANHFRQKEERKMHPMISVV